jgi:hypothetical protein
MEAITQRTTRAVCCRRNCDLHQTPVSEMSELEL